MGEECDPIGSDSSNNQNNENLNRNENLMCGVVEGMNK
jgi:hypothetical protein